jgi:glycosyltransferase involved in cell wall biosynthesis
VRIALVADTFPPLRSSGAVQLRDLSLEFLHQGHDITVLVASPQQTEASTLEQYHGVRVLRLRTPQMKDVSYVRRMVAELLMPFYMQFHYSRSSMAQTKWDAVIWYSPSIFLGPLVRYLAVRSRCPTYLIIRDIFPEWAADMGLIGRGLPYYLLKGIARFQYSVANTIGIQTPGNSVYFEKWQKHPGRRLEVLQNWLADAPAENCSISIKDSSLQGRRIFVYAGNMGIAQGMEHILRLAAAMADRDDIGFVFVGRGTASKKLRDMAREQRLQNVLFYDEIDPDEIPALYAQCHAGIVSLDVRHKTHNIPGKFISYMQAGLPALAVINPGNDLEILISENEVGVVTSATDTASLVLLTEQLLEHLENTDDVPSRCRNLYKRLFSPKTAVSQIVEALQR